MMASVLVKLSIEIYVSKCADHFLVSPTIQTQLFSFQTSIMSWSSSSKGLNGFYLSGAVFKSIDLFHNGDQLKYSFVLMLISLSNLAAMGKIQKNISTKVRPVGLINAITKEQQNTPLFMKVLYNKYFLLLPWICEAPRQNHLEDEPWHIVPDHGDTS